MWYGKADYFTARSLEGISLLNPADPSKEGKNRDQATDSLGHYYSRELTELVRGPGEGYVTFNTTNPDTKADEEKVTFIKLYKPWGIAIATGVFIGDIAAETHAAMLRAGLVTLLLVGVIGSVVMWVASGIAKPLMRLRAAMLDLAAGRAISGTLETERRDEIGAMASTVKVFQDNALALKAAEVEAAEQQRAAEENRKRADEPAGTTMRRALRPPGKSPTWWRPSAPGSIAWPRAISPAG
jgi:methyl-accepting chemotaxis protein